MSTKTIALEVSVYDKLLGRKKPSESFTKTIDRLISETRDQNTCAAAGQIWKVGSEREAQIMDKTLRKNCLRKNREPSAWDVEPLE
jgi:predicted CopG family antitoxin